MSEKGVHRIRPAGRHILTIGRDLIQDSHAAVIELVKNAYDADAKNVEIKFQHKPEKNGYTIEVFDDGHGMSRDTVVNKWMVPSTQDKLKRQISPGGRIMQGSKGIGRYATAILGSGLMLESVTKQGEKTEIYLQWNEFEKADYLDDVDVLIDTKAAPSEPNGTTLKIDGGHEFLTEWDQAQFGQLRHELKKLIPPADWDYDVATEEFEIKLQVTGLPGLASDIDEIIEPYPIIRFFDYRIAGEINADGKGSLIYSQAKEPKNEEEQEISFNWNSPTDCGKLIYDIRVYDREGISIQKLIERSDLKDEAGRYIGRNEARHLLNANNGISVFRNGFRIRPLGDPHYDWLRLDSRRVQNPSMRIGRNQVIGYVKIESEEQSGLIENSARNGLRDNLAYTRLKKLTADIMTELEIPRYKYRERAGLSRKKQSIENSLHQLYNFDDLKRRLQGILKYAINPTLFKEILSYVDLTAEKRAETVENISKSVAVYQGQVSLGKIMNIVLHEGRRPLHYFHNQIPHLEHLYSSFSEETKQTHGENLNKALKGISENGNVLSQLFRRLDPLAMGKRSKVKPVRVKEYIHSNLAIFKDTLKKEQIDVELSGDNNVTLLCWHQDIYAIFTNLIDNSIYWLANKKCSERKIRINIETKVDSLLHIDYQDTGPGIASDSIDSGILFDPEYSEKPEGTGLGLAIAREAATRNNLQLIALESELGAWFRLQPIEEG